jgi:hypothetical protein
MRRAFPLEECDSMGLDVSKILSELGDDMAARCGGQVGLNHDQSVRVAHALSAHIGRGREEAVRAAAADAGLGEEVVASMLNKLIEEGGKKLMEDSPVGDAIQSAKAAAGDAMANAAGGMFGKIGGMFGRK